MTDNYKQQLILAGVDINSAIDRFMGNEIMYNKFLLRFLKDDSFSNLENCIASNEYQMAFMQAHTMKGVVANLGLDCLLEILTPMTEQLRSNDLVNISEEIKELKLRYEMICNIIRATD